MIFNSVIFLFFFVLFFALYWFVFNRSLRLQNLFLLLAGYLFYAWSDWRFLAYLIGISALNFFLGICMEKTASPVYKNWLLYVGLIQGIGGLGFFKYFNFFITSFKDAFHLLGISLNLHTLNIIVPLGISFFTFRTLSYLLDINKGKIKPEKNWVIFFAYVSFFPSIMSGPIDRAKNLIPQLEKNRAFDYSQATDGLRQILWGLFKKIVIADNCAPFVNQVFNNYQSYSSSSLLLGAFLYAIQIYADFSGYSDMAIGISRLMGFNIARNFDFPFFAQNIAEFWRKWHMSLTSWLTDYVFTPLSIAFRDYGKLGLTFAIVINFTICGIWHGANWTYVLFGFLHGCYFIPLILSSTMNKKKKTAKGRLLPSLRELINMLATFVLVMLTFIIFRSDNLQQAFHYISSLFTKSLLSIPDIAPWYLLLLIAVFLMIEWSGREYEFAIASMGLKLKQQVRWAIYLACSMLILYFNFYNTKTEFIYFQF